MGGVKVNIVFLLILILFFKVSIYCAIVKIKRIVFCFFIDLFYKGSLKKFRKIFLKNT